MCYEADNQSIKTHLYSAICRKRNRSACWARLGRVFTFSVCMCQTVQFSEHARNYWISPIMLVSSVIQTVTVIGWSQGARWVVVFDEVSQTYLDEVTEQDCEEGYLLTPQFVLHKQLMTVLLFWIKPEHSSGEGTRSCGAEIVERKVLWKACVSTRLKTTGYFNAH